MAKVPMHKIKVVLKDGYKETLTPILVWNVSVINKYNKNSDYTIRNIVNDIKDEIVIDIGANIADTSIYFALRGAKKVIALEPSPYSYKFAHLNITANNLQDIIELLNAGYGIDKKIYVDEKIETGTCTSYISNETVYGKQIDVYSLNTLVNRYNINSAVLKMDCEGCEYSLLTENDDILKTFKKIQIEYHYGYKNLKEKLERCGFKVEYTKPIKIYNKIGKVHNMNVGYIYGKI
ncbi:MAG: FkbM family methyltransferase [Thermoplasmata archaeon]